MGKGFLFILIFFSAPNLWAQQMHLFIQDSPTKHELLMDMLDSQEATCTNGVTWELGTCSWSETAALRTVTQLPGVYVQPETGLAIALNIVRVEELNHFSKTVKFRLVNPIKFAANESILVESGQAARQTVGSFVLKPLLVVHLDTGASAILEYTASGSLKIRQN